MARMPRIQAMTCFYVVKTYSLVEIAVTLNIYLIPSPLLWLCFHRPYFCSASDSWQFSFPCFCDLLQSVLDIHIATAFNSSQSKQLIFFSELVNSVAHRKGRDWKLQKIPLTYYKKYLALYIDA